MADAMRLWDDNPSVIDLLGFDAVVEPIHRALELPDLDPLTIGVQSPWGGGKSTVLKLVGAALKDDPRYVVIGTDPWQYDSHDDVRGTLIAEILDQLREHFDDNAAIKARVKELLKRISWSRVGIAITKGALTMQWSPTELAEALTPKERSSPESMSGFRIAFAELIELLPEVQRVVVLVDDLDRCLPNAVMATLESIKLFLSVPGMVFVVAADQDMVRDAIVASLNASNRSERFANRYLEKIVQLPISLPRLAPHDAEAYIGLLLAKHAAPDESSFDALVIHCGERRIGGKTPLLGDLETLDWKPDVDALNLAAQLAQGLSADRLANPRQIKRFLNAFGVRRAVAAARKVPITPAVLVKMLLLEDQHRAAFEVLAGATSAERRSLLAAWEMWARGKAEKPSEGVPEGMKEWAAAEPLVSTIDLNPYLQLAASLLNIGSAAQVSDAVAEQVQALLGEGDAARDAALETLASLGASEQADALELLFSYGRRLDDLDVMFTASIRWAQRNPDLVDRVRGSIEENWQRLTAGAVVELASSSISALAGLVPRIANDSSLDPMVREAAAMEGQG